MQPYFMVYCLESLPKPFSNWKFIWRRWDSNPRPSESQSNMLPTGCPDWIHTLKYPCLKFISSSICVLSKLPCWCDMVYLPLEHTFGSMNAVFFSTLPSSRIAPCVGTTWKWYRCHTLAMPCLATLGLVWSWVKRQVVRLIYNMNKVLEISNPF